MRQGQCFVITEYLELLSFIDKDEACYHGWQGNGWYYWVRNYSKCIGPFETYDEATIKLKDYIKSPQYSLKD